MLRYSLNMLNFGSNVINLPCVVCLTVGYAVLIEYEWNGLKVSDVDTLKNRNFLEAIASHLNL